jgi:hypothetical protein
VKKIYAPSKIYVSQSKIDKAGMGVFANTGIKKGEVIEICPFIDIPQYQLESVGNSIFVNYVYFYGNVKEKLLLALGFGSIYNHSRTPNAFYKINPKEKTIEFVSNMVIKKDEEVCVNYVQGNRTKRPLWFEG